jgi:arsenite-transporting ATPase
MQLERDLARAGITPFAWVVNQSLTPLSVTDPVLRLRRANEASHLQELEGHAARTVLEPWSEAFSRREGQSAVAAAVVQA